MTEAPPTTALTFFCLPHQLSPRLISGNYSKTRLGVRYSRNADTHTYTGTYAHTFVRRHPLRRITRRSTAVQEDHSRLVTFHVGENLRSKHRPPTELAENSYQQVPWLWWLCISVKTVVSVCRRATFQQHMKLCPHSLTGLAGRVGSDHPSVSAHSPIH